MIGIDNIVAIIWVVFWVYWFISAASAKKNLPGSPSRGGIGFRFRLFVLIVIIFVILSQIPGARELSLQAGPFSHNLIVGIIGIILLAIGLLFAIWARVNLGRNWGMPMSLKEDRELVTTGPYRFVRHPIYTGIIIAFIGSALVAGLYWMVILAVLSGYFVYSSTVEEKMLLREFPNQYPEYQKHTKRLIPFIW